MCVHIRAFFKLAAMLLLSVAASANSLESPYTDTVLLCATTDEAHELIQAGEVQDLSLEVLTEIAQSSVSRLRCETTQIAFRVMQRDGSESTREYDVYRITIYAQRDPLSSELVPLIMPTLGVAILPNDHEATLQQQDVASSTQDLAAGGSALDEDGTHEEYLVVCYTPKQVEVFLDFYQKGDGLWAAKMVQRMFELPNDACVYGRTVYTQEEVIREIDMPDGIVSIVLLRMYEFGQTRFAQKQLVYMYTYRYTSSE